MYSDEFVIMFIMENTVRSGGFPGIVKKQGGAVFVFKVARHILKMRMS